MAAMSSSVTQPARTRTGSGSPSHHTHPTPGVDSGMREQSAPRSRAPRPNTRSVCSASARASAMRVGNRSRNGSTSLRGSCSAATTTTPTARPLGQQQRQRGADLAALVPVGVGGERGELVHDDHDQRLIGGGFVQAGPAPQPPGPGLHHRHGVLEHGGHHRGRLVGEPVEQRRAGGHLHAALRVEHPQTDQAVTDARAEPADQRPHHRALARPGLAGNQGVRTPQPDHPGPAVLPAADRHRPEIHRSPAAGAW